MFLEPGLTKTEKVLHTKGKNTWQDFDIWRTIINHFNSKYHPLFTERGSWLKDNQGSCPKPQHQSLAELQLEVSGCQHYFQSLKLAARPQPQSWYPVCSPGEGHLLPTPQLQSHHQHQGRMNTLVCPAPALMPSSPHSPAPAGAHPEGAAATPRSCPGTTCPMPMLPLKPRERQSEK